MDHLVVRHTFLTPAFDPDVEPPVLRRTVSSSDVLQTTAVVHTDSIDITDLSQVSVEEVTDPISCKIHEVMQFHACPFESCSLDVTHSFERLELAPFSIEMDLPSQKMLFRHLEKGAIVFEYALSLIHI